jgi:hypothetical protein
VNGFIHHLCIPLRTTSNYSANANFHTSQITTELAKTFPDVPWQRLLTVEILQLHALRSSCQSRPCRNLVNCQHNYSAISPHPPLQSSTNWLLHSLLCYLLGTDRIDNTSFPPVVCVTVAAGTCLPSRCPETGLI